MSEKNNNLKKKVEKAINDENFDDVSSLIEETVETAISLVRSGVHNFKGYLDKKSPLPVVKRENVVVQKNPIFPVANRNNILGIGLMALGFFFLLALIIEFELIFAIIMGICFSAGGNMRKKSKELRKKAFRFDRYKKELGYSPVQSVKALAEAVGVEPELVRKELDEYITKDYFKQGRLVRNKKIFVLDDKTYDRYIKDEYGETIRNAVYEEVVEDLEDIDTKDTDDIEAEQGAEAVLKEYINELNMLNTNITGPLNTKVNRLISTMGSIYYHLKKDPTAAKSARKFVDYYVPTVIKLLESYIGFSKISTPGENTTHAMNEIEKSMDTINSAFEKFLDNLFADSAMDISTDISVLKTMMKQDGLLEDDFKIGD